MGLVGSNYKHSLSFYNPGQKVSPPEVTAKNVLGPVIHLIIAIIINVIIIIAIIIIIIMVIVIVIITIAIIIVINILIPTIIIRFGWIFLGRPTSGGKALSYSARGSAHYRGGIAY